MTDPGYPYAQPVKPRPTVVDVASYLLFATAALYLINSVLAVSFLGALSDATQEAYKGTPGEGAEAAVVVGSGVGAGVSLLAALGMVALAIFNKRGSKASRIVTWVLGGFVVCCTGFGAAGNAIVSAIPVGSSTGGDLPDSLEIQRRIDDALPGWYNPLTTTISVLVVLLMLATVILLALPASNEYFRTVQAAWVPGYQTYPGHQPAAPLHPGQATYPPYPGQAQPPYPGQSPHPGQSPYPAPAATPPYPAPQSGAEWSAPAAQPGSDGPAQPGPAQPGSDGPATATPPGSDGPAPAAPSHHDGSHGVGSGGPDSPPASPPASGDQPPTA